MKAKLLITFLLAGQVLAADLPPAFHHVRLTAMEFNTTPQPLSLKAVLGGWLPGIPFASQDGPDTFRTGTTKQLKKHFEFSRTTARYGINDRLSYQPVNSVQHWSSAAKIQFHF